MTGYYSNSRLDMMVRVPASARSLLDVGCGTGGFGRELKLRRPEVRVVGIEPEQSVAAEARKVLDSVIVGVFPDSIPDDRFDCVVFNDSLEHMIDPGKALRAAALLLTRGGSIVGSIPNVRHISIIRELIFKGDWRYRESGILDRTHLRFFTCRSLQRLIAESDLELVSIEMKMPTSPGRAERFLRLFGWGHAFAARQIAFSATSRCECIADTAEHLPDR